MSALRDSFSGDVVLSDDPGYEEGRKVFNAMIDRRPVVIARCVDTADVAAAVDFTRRGSEDGAVASA